MTITKCPCCSGNNYSECCQLLHNGTKADSPEQLMRSRYSAFALGKVDYLLETSSEQLRKTLTAQELQQTCSAFEFISLEIVLAEDDTVEFIANLLMETELNPLHETSRFIQQEGSWKYDTGTLHETPIIKLGRNDKCPCGSGKKFKQCHMK